MIGLTRLLPFTRPYLPQVVLAIAFLLLAAASTLAIPVALRTLIDAGFDADTALERIGAMRGHFGLLFGIAVALGAFTALRYYMVTWLGERVIADVRKAVYARVLEQSPEFFETTRTGEVLSRLTADATLVQTVVGSSLSMGLRSAILFAGGLTVLVITNPRVSLTAIAITTVFVLPAMLIGRRLRRLSRTSQDRVADSSAIATEVLNSVTVVQSFVQERRERLRFDAATERA
ncbi:MAG: ABC transporter, partial [Burkholderiales bacterium]